MVRSTLPINPSDLYSFATFQVREGTRDALKAARDMARDPKGWLVITGPKGVGKTHLAYAVCREWGSSPFLPVRVSNLLDLWRSRYDKEDFDYWFETHSNASRFALDDLGAERPTEWAIERLTMFLDHRYGHQLPTVITTNLDEDSLAEKLNSRIADRVFDLRTGICQLVTIEASSFRTGRVW